MHDPEEDNVMKIQKYHYRMRDLYVHQAENKAVILPDWRVRSDDRLPRLELFFGSMDPNRTKKPYETTKKNIDNLKTTDFIIECKADEVKKYVKSQADNPNFKISGSLKVPRAPAKRFQSDTHIEESYAEKMTRLDIEKRV